MLVEADLCSVVPLVSIESPPHQDSQTGNPLHQVEFSNVTHVEAVQGYLLGLKGP